MFVLSGGGIYARGLFVMFSFALLLLALSLCVKAGSYICVKVSSDEKTPTNFQGIFTKTLNPSTFSEGINLVAPFSKGPFRIVNVKKMGFFLFELVLT